MEQFEIVTRHTEIVDASSSDLEDLKALAKHLIASGNTDYQIRHVIHGTVIETAELTDYFNE